jgi:hypothetical protein
MALMVLNMLEISIIFPPKRIRYKPPKFLLVKVYFSKKNFLLLSIGRAYNIKMCRIVEFYRLNINRVRAEKGRYWGESVPRV